MSDKKYDVDAEKDGCKIEKKYKKLKDCKYYFDSGLLTIGPGSPASPGIPCAPEGP